MAGRVESTRYPGVYRVHRRTCDHAACRCPGAYQATVYSVREGKRLRKHFDTLGAARTWREDAGAAVRAGTLRTPTRTTLEQAAEALIAGMNDGSIYDRSGRAYKPSTVRSYECALRRYILPVLGHRRLSTIERRDVQQHLVERLHGQGLAASTIQNILNPLQVISRRAVHAGEMTIDPTVGLNLPAVRGRRDRIAGPEQARVLIDALPESERAYWSTAFFAGLRRGELRALRWRHVDFDQRLIRVDVSWDPVAGEIEVKTDAGRRVVPMADGLRRELAAHKLRSGRSDDDLVLGRTGTLPFVPSTVRARALTAWGWKQVVDPDARPARTWVKAREDALEPLTAHEARHCAASYLIAAGLNAKELSVYIGHSDIRTTYNRYGHLMPGGEAAAADRLSAFLDAQAREAGR